jgi:hypothetical protein
MTNAVNIAQIGSNNVSFRNRIINGQMQIAQRATSGTSGSSVPTTTATYPSIDRWYAYATGATVTVAQVAGTVPIKNNLEVTGAASVTAVGVGQRIEQLNSYDLAGSTATLSVNISNTLLTTVTWTASYATSADTWSAKTQIATGTFTVTSTLTKYTANISIPSAATTGIEILFTVGAQISGTWTIGNVQLEAGSTASPFENRSYGVELALCQRYLPAFTAISGTVGPLPGIATALTTNVNFIFNHPVPARIPGTGVTVSGGTHFQFSNNDGNSASTAVTFGASSPNASQLAITVASTRGATTTPGWIYANTASAILYITGCEL